MIFVPITAKVSFTELKKMLCLNCKKMDIKLEHLIMASFGVMTGYLPQKIFD